MPGELTLRMITVDPDVRTTPHLLSDIGPTACSGRLAERSRLEWRYGSGGDPALLLAGFLTEAGLSIPDRSDVFVDNSAWRDIHAGVDRGVCGAAVFISAAAGAAMIGAPVGPPSPVPAVPDLVAVLFEHGPPPAGPPSARPGPGGWALDAWRPSWTPHEHAAGVRRVRAAIADGEVYQVNLVGHASAAYDGDPAGALHRVTRLPGARYSGVLSGDGWALACASPETLVEVRGGRAVTRPIKGTRPATVRGRAELLASAKERAEHVMIVDLERNDLARIARTGSVRVDELYAVRRWCDLWQAESTVSAQIEPGAGLADLLRALCPGGSVTGAPKRAALDVIAALEPVGRGPSMGAFGWIGPERIDLGLTIRTVAVDADRVHVWAGGGITWGSDPDAEVAEAAAKAAPLRAALRG
ncbi:MAG: aminodeoxychorismate synthase component I [Actinobacteria bacterium 13_2_20CM_2_71_6]|nr:MAG: aminodeoxychorismate synthase component I [Actinobacteria bacterium 13_2_20CM_2_71_6]